MTGLDRFVDPVLVALSDLLVMTALERASSRTLPRSLRGHQLAQHERHTAYLHTAIPADKIGYGLTGAWALCPYLVARHDLDLDPAEWALLLDGYTTALLMACEPHEPDRLRPYLEPLAVGERWTRPFLAVAR